MEGRRGDPDEGGSDVRDATRDSLPNSSAMAASERAGHIRGGETKSPSYPGLQGLGPGKARERSSGGHADRQCLAEAPVDEQSEVVHKEAKGGRDPTSVRREGKHQRATGIHEN